jgi:hypothetical protein
MTTPPKSPEEKPGQAGPPSPAEGKDMLRPGSVFVGQDDFRFALEGGFSEDEVAFMFDLDDPTSEEDGD